MQTEFKIANPHDADWVVARHGEIYRREFGFDATFKGTIRQKMSALLARPEEQRTLWIAMSGGVRAGSIALSRLDDGTGFLNFVLVCPRFRGRGLGRALVAHALAAARQRGFTSVRLETYSCLARARTLYRANGFRIESRQAGETLFGQRFEREFWTLRLTPASSAVSASST